MRRNTEMVASEKNRATYNPQVCEPNGKKTDTRGGSVNAEKKRGTYNPYIV